MNKTEAKLARSEVRSLKAALNTRQKQTAREIKKHRDSIRKSERLISQIESETAAYVRSTTDRLAIIQGRLES